MEEKTRHISFHFHPRGFEDKTHAVMKDEGGKQRMYLGGIASGLDEDGHGERMTERCIKSFHDQASSGTVLLYEGQHGVDFVDDIGILTNSTVGPVGNWETEFRLYDENDDMGAMTIEKALKLWKQVNGLPPYPTPIQKGFSIEGYIPDGGILSVDKSGRRVIDDVALDGVLVVPRPAYKDSIATAVYKALGVPAPWVIQKNLTKTITEKIEESEASDEYYKKRYQLEDALQEEVRIIMNGEDASQREMLDMLFDEYKGLMIDLTLTACSSVFETIDVDDNPMAVYKAPEDGKQDLFVQLEEVYNKLKDLKEKEYAQS